MKKFNLNPQKAAMKNRRNPNQQEHSLQGRKVWMKLSARNKGL